MSTIDYQGGCQLFISKKDVNYLVIVKEDDYDCKEDNYHCCLNEDDTCLISKDKIKEDKIKSKYYYFQKKMSEFPSLGENCMWAACNDLDFLPIVCQFCKLSFCKLHFLPESHSCTQLVDVRPDNLVKNEVRYSCEVEKCGKWEIAPVKCQHCSMQVCLNHRYQDTHSCPKLDKKSGLMLNTKAHVESILANKTTKTEIITPRSKAAQKTAAKVQLMKLKMKSKGQTSLPDSEKIYFLVHPPKESQKPAIGCIVGKEWSLGRIIDALAELTGTRNENNVTGARKLRLFRKDGELVVGSSELSTKLSTLLDSETLFNGDTIHLDFET
ncbi:AN1-type zinc finger protein 1 [Eurytemora carolleeae]|uniref:AN1-type zinc finger protein 1 n=1 Tax=Eurytemora carolleeae TaxID=1294199 RepID=UPI000C763923|nr:AN1-type zinc finger protein 1 [Eurytemora carolleeae]|eukprot:XP_023333840.1 AN1-type zinc finger protein 1-like [Eurytemora affinis]